MGVCIKIFELINQVDIVAKWQLLICTVFMMIDILYKHFKRGLKSFSFRSKVDTAIEGEQFVFLEDGQYLKIISTEKGDSGKYVCVASNTEGMSAVTAVLDVKGISAT